MTSRNAKWTKKNISATCRSRRNLSSLIFPTQTHFPENLLDDISLNTGVCDAPMQLLPMPSSRICESNQLNQIDFFLIIPQSLLVHASRIPELKLTQDSPREIIHLIATTSERMLYVDVARKMRCEIISTFVQLGIFNHEFYIWNLKRIQSKFDVYEFSTLWLLCTTFRRNSKSIFRCTRLMHPYARAQHHRKYPGIEFSATVLIVSFIHCFDRSYFNWINGRSQHHLWRVSERRESIGLHWIEMLLTSTLLSLI